MVDGGTSCAPREGDLSIQSGDGGQMNVDEEVEGACVAGNRQPAGQNVQAGGSVGRNLDSSALCREPYYMLPIGIPGMDPRLFSPVPMQFSKLAMYGIPEAGTIHHGNNGRNSSDSGSNCPDMQLQDK